MAAAVPTTVSTLLGDPTKWTAPDPGYAALTAVLGEASGNNAAACALAVRNFSYRTPTVVAYVQSGDDDHIYVAHSPSMFPSDPTTASPFDGHLVLLVGDDLTVSQPVVLTATSFTRTAETRTKTAAIS